MHNPFTIARGLVKVLLFCYYFQVQNLSILNHVTYLEIELSCHELLGLLAIIW